MSWRRWKALANPALLVWARESAGYTLAEAAKKAQLNPKTLVSCEADIARHTIPQLRKLANVYKRPLAVFYLPQPPQGFDVLPDFRRLPGEIAGRQSPELRRAVRQARLRRQTALDLYRAV